MAIKTFTAGEVLTASDTNTFLANSGLVYVKSQTVGTGVASVTVSDAFSATYDSYKIIYNGGSQSAASALTLKLGTTATGYSYGLIYNAFTTATATASWIGASNAAQWIYVGQGTTNGSTVNCELLNPYASVRTTISSTYVEMPASASGGFFMGLLDNTTSYTAFTLAPFSGTMTGGTITVYGYRKA